MPEFQENTRLKPGSRSHLVGRYPGAGTALIARQSLFKRLKADDER
jgi:hypothetical protein